MPPLAPVLPLETIDAVEPNAEQRPFLLPGCTWEQYVALDELFEEQRIRIRYLDHWIEIMFPISQNHERRKSHLGRLVETWCLERVIEFFINGSTTMRKEKEAGGHPDESYVFHEDREDRPDLVIEIALTSGGLSKRAFYRKFGVPELWIWRKDRLEVHFYTPAKADYVPSEQSTVLPGIPLADVEECARLEGASQAIREFRKRIAGPPIRDS